MALTGKCLNVSVQQYCMLEQKTEIEIQIGIKIGIKIKKRLHEQPISIAISISISMPPNLAKSAGNSHPVNSYE